MSIPIKYVFGVLFWIFAMVLLYQGILLKASKLNANLFLRLNPRARVMMENATREMMNKLGNISLVIAAIFLTQALLVYIYPLKLHEIMRGGAISMFITVLVGIFFVFR